MYREIQRPLFKGSRAGEAQNRIYSFHHRPYARPCPDRLYKLCKRIKSHKYKLRVPTICLSWNKEIKFHFSLKIKFHFSFITQWILYLDKSFPEVLPQAYTTIFLKTSKC